MIWHGLEIWLLMLATFVIGCSLGASLYAVLAASPLAHAQGILADAIGDATDRIKGRFGQGRSWSGDPELKTRRARYQAADDWPEDTLTGDWQDARPGVEAVPASSRPIEWDVGGDDGFGLEGEADVGGGEETWSAPQPELPAMRPLGLSAPRNGVPDNLQRIRGIGQKNEEFLYSIGIFHFSQIASWTPAEVRWVSTHLRFPERIDRDDWIGQAIVLASGGDTGYVKPPRTAADDAASFAENNEG